MGKGWGRMMGRKSNIRRKEGCLFLSSSTSENDGYDTKGSRMLRCLHFFLG